jgi:ankyrin repeat protein
MSAGDWKDLFRAADEGDFELVKYHVKRGVNVNYQHPEILMTVLVTAIKNGHTEIALFLLENGADPRLESYFDQMRPLDAALKFDNKLVLNKLEELGLRPSLLGRLFKKTKDLIR